MNNLTRDMDLIREILIAIDSMPTQLGQLFSSADIKIENYTFSQIQYNFDLIQDAGLVKVPQGNRKLGSGECMFFGLSNAGYDFLENIRNVEVWEQTKKEVEKRKLPKTIKVIAEVAGIFVGSAIKKILGGNE